MIELPRTTRFDRRWLIIGGAGALVAAAVVVAVILLRPSPVIDRSIVNEASFSVYAPHKAPKNYTLQSDATKLDTSSKLLTYEFRNEADDRKITVTVQPPPGVRMSQMTEGGSVQQTATANGTLYDLSVGESSTFLLDTGDSFIFFRSTAKIDTNTINSLVSSMKKLN